ncbi:transcription termination factor MTERF4, chloroplastic [Cornus florida]|uniref:transcription termination factor MTERF4, chloroplastic n=1 Tax=Cornus florida TaxID=4283 RepID=UPI00289C2B8E|nr:transcription termination factor MTERF4, chloroplastic [Cornus florida]
MYSSSVVCYNNNKLLQIQRNFTIISLFNTHPHHRNLFLFTNPNSHNNNNSNISFNCNKFPLKISLQKNLSFNHHHHRLLQASSVGQSSSSSKEEEQAREAVSEILQEFGVSKDDSLNIALNSPKYVEMLIDSVRQLDELSLSLWDSWNSSQQQQQGAVEEGLSFKEKVYRVAKDKGDNGSLPFLESLGLSLSSASQVARYVSSHSHTLPELIRRVKYVKEMFFSDSDDKGFLGKNARRMMMHLSIPIDEDVQQTLSFFEKIEAKRGGLDMLGSKDASFRYLIESFPRLLFLPIELHMKQMVGYLEDIGVSKGCMREILLLFPPVIFYNIEKDFKPRMQVFEKVGAEDEDFGRMLLKYPWIMSTGIQGNFKEILSFFDMEKVPKASVEHAIKSWPHLLGCSISKLKLMVKQFDDLGVRSKKLGQVIAKSPQLLLRKPQEFLQVVSFFKDLGLDEETIGRILCRCPEIFATSIEKTLKKKLDFLSGIGVSKNHLPRVIRKYPELFVCDVNRALLPRIKFLLKAGLRKRDVAFMIGRFSPLLGYSIEEVLRPKLEFLVNTMEKPLLDVVDYPRYFSYSLEKKIKPRYWVLKGRNVECSLKDMLAKNDDEFATEFMGLGRMLVPPTPSPE